MSELQGIDFVRHPHRRHELVPPGSAVSSEADQRLIKEECTFRIGRRTRFYRVTPTGRKQLSAECEDWAHLSAAIISALVSVGATITDKFLDAFGEPVDSAKRGALRFHQN